MLRTRTVAGDAVEEFTCEEIQAIVRVHKRTEVTTYSVTTIAGRVFRVAVNCETFSGQLVEGNNVEFFDTDSDGTITFE